MDGITAYALSKKVATSAVSGVKSMSVDGQTLTINTKDSGVLKMVFPTPSNGRSVTDIDVNDKNQIVFTMSDGTEITSGVIPTVKGADGKPGKDGDPFTYDDFTKEQLEELKGKDGVSPTVTITESTGRHTISFYDKDGVKSITIKDGSPEDMANYYKKTETYSQTEVNTLLANINKLTSKIVTELPSENISESTIYLIEVENQKNVYMQYMYINGSFAALGTTAIDLSNVYTKGEVDKKLEEKADKTKIPTFTNKAVLDGITSEKVADWDEAVTTKTALEAHTNSIVSSKTGVHGMRYFNGTLQVQNEDNEWIDIETGGSGGGGIAPNNVSDINLKTGNTKLTISWSDPSDTIIEGQTLCTWKGTKLVQKVGSFPKNPKDGTLILDNQTRDKYKTNGFEITGLTNGETYYFVLFPYSDTGAVNTNVANRTKGTPQAYRTMTVKIDQSNSNPATCCTYDDDATGMTAGSSDWDDFFGHYPCMLNNGVEGVKLNPDNFAKDVDGNNVDITSGSAGDVMIAFPRRGLKISTSGSVVTISMTDDPDAEGFEYNAHTRGSTAKDVFYLGAYKGYESSSKLRSLSGKTITASKTIGAFRTSAQANGSGYEQSGFYQLIFRQAMYVLKYKNLDSQSTIGQGYVNSTNSAAIATGGSEAYGMDSEIIRSSTPSHMTDQEHHVKLFGLEDFWGNIWEWIDGLVTNSTRNILTANSSFNDSGSGYTDNGQGASADIGGYMNKVQGGTKTGFIAKEVSGSTSTYYTDYGDLCAGRVALFGGDWNDDAGAGAFRLDVDYASSGSNASIAARLMYL